MAVLIVGYTLPAGKVSSVQGMLDSFHAEDKETEGGKNVVQTLRQNMSQGKCSDLIMWTDLCPY